MIEKKGIFHDDLIGLLVTKERQEKVVENWKYIENSPHPVVILDDSVYRSEKLFELSGNTGHVEYCHLPGKDPVERHFIGLEKYNSAKYVLPMTDDDILISFTVSKCISFLKTHPAYSAAQGTFWQKTLDQNNENLEKFTRSLSSPDPRKRLIRQSRYYSHTFYSIQRKEFYVKAMQNAIDLGPDSWAFQELAQSLSMVGFGKIKRYLIPYGIRSPNSKENLSQRYKYETVSWFKKDYEEFCHYRNIFESKMAAAAPFKSVAPNNTKEFLNHLVEELLNDNIIGFRDLLTNKIVQRVYGTRIYSHIKDSVANYENNPDH